MRKAPFVNKEYYHIFNRGVDKRKVFLSGDDFNRFLQSMDEFNSVAPIGSIYENSFNKKQLGHSMSKLKKEKDKLVNFICYCINPNHYHFLLEQVFDNGIEKFMQRLGNGYTKFFNNKYLRSGSLFQGRYKSVHVDSNEYLLHLSVYINLNDKVHRLGHSMSKSSWDEYISGGNYSFCNKGIILDQFNKIKDYETFANDSLEPIIQKKEMGESGYRLKQIKKAVFVDLIKDWEEATTLSKELREEIKKEFNISGLENLNLIESKNGDSIKAIFRLKDGNIIETVLMRHLNTKEDDAKAGRNTVCVSSQAGCAMNCGFCATGKIGLKRNLTSEEIIDQILFFARHLRQWQGEPLKLVFKVSPCHERYEKVNNVVFMGMGEPFLNYENTIQAIRILNNKDGFNLGIRHISVSTCGIIPGIEKFAE